MLDAGTYTATLDRFEETPESELAVLVVEHGGEPVSQLDLPVAAIPEEGRSVDAVFSLVVTADRFELTYQTDDSARRAESARDRFDRLARRPPPADDGGHNTSESET